MKGIMCLISCVILFGIMYFGEDYFFPSYTVETNTCEVVPDNIKAAIYIMGPGYQYRLHPDGKLEVWLDGKWLNLNY